MRVKTEEASPVRGTVIVIGIMAEIVKDHENGTIGGIETREEEWIGEGNMIAMEGMEGGVRIMVVNVKGAGHGPLLGMATGGDLRVLVADISRQWVV